MKGRLRVVVALGALVAVGGGCRRGDAGASGGGAAADEALTQSYTSQNGLVVAHYPADFAAKNTSESVMLVSRNVGGHDEYLTFASNDKPVSDDPDEYARVFLLAQSKKEAERGSTVVETSRTKGTCFGAMGVELRSTWTRSAPGAVPYTRYSCTFVKDGHGFSLGYGLPLSKAASDEELLRKILLATKVGS